jgi:hypothetical protein
MEEARPDFDKEVGIVLRRAIAQNPRLRVHKSGSRSRPAGVHCDCSELVVAERRNAW